MNKIIIIGCVVFLQCGTAFAEEEAAKEAPDCQLSAADGNKLNLTQYKGQVIYVDFWASWCPPCLKSFPFMNELHQQFKQKGLKIIAVNLDEQKKDAGQFLSNNTTDFSIAYDNDNKDCAQVFEVKAMPSSYLIDREGRVRHTHLGFKSGETEALRSLIATLLKQAGK